MRSKRVQQKGWSVVENTKTRKTSINLDTDIANVIEEKKKSTDFPFGKIVNDSLRSHFGLVI